MADLSLHPYISQTQLDQLIRRALDEDLGPQQIDLTTQLTVEPQQQATGQFCVRQEGWLSGVAVLGSLAAAVDPGLSFQSLMDDSSELRQGDVVATVSGSLSSILILERTALNLLTHLSGIATLTRQFVKAVEGTAAKICDTRKSLPGLRALEKYAVACGGGVNHRIGLYDAVLIKDNHIAHVGSDQLESWFVDAVARARKISPAPGFIEIEVDTLEQLAKVLPAGPDMVLLDNMRPKPLAEAVTMRNDVAPNVILEASGGVTLQTVRVVAESGMDRIAVGALTHSAASLDIGLDIQ